MINRVKLPQGFQAAGINSGVRRYRPDLGMVISDCDAMAAGTFTKNTLKAAPVLYCQKLLPSDKVRAIVVNSGHANAATGVEGEEDNLQLATRTAETVGVPQQSVLVSSTGVIGERMPLEKLLPALASVYRSRSDVINNFALSIMTTDLVPKFVSRDVELSGGTVVITGCAKGSGMIHPNMGTMLGYILCDAEVELEWLDKSVKEIVDLSFNMISVDGETSTNDSVLVLCNGASKVQAKSDADKKLLFAALLDVSTKLAISIARDGEGASKLITVKVRNYPDLAKAREIARMITISPLIKTAIHGEDPNWGRILARLGQAGVDTPLFAQLNLRLQDVPVFTGGKPVKFDRPALRALLHAESIVIDADFGSGSCEAVAWGCDLTRRYVEINTEYS